MVMTTNKEMCTKCVPTFRGGAWATPPSYDVYIQPLPEFRIWRCYKFSSTEFVDRIKHTCSTLVGGMTMSVQLAPRPKNEDRRVVAVKRTGIIDSDQSENFSVFGELAKELTNFDYIAFSLFDENYQCKISTTNGTDNEKKRTYRIQRVFIRTFEFWAHADPRSF